MGRFEIHDRCGRDDGQYLGVELQRGVFTHQNDSAGGIGRDANNVDDGSTTRLTSKRSADVEFCLVAFDLAIQFHHAVIGDGDPNRAGVFGIESTDRCLKFGFQFASRRGEQKGARELRRLRVGSLRQGR